MTTPARDTVRSNYRRMEAAVEPTKVCAWCRPPRVLSEGTEPATHVMCREHEIAQYAELAGRHRGPFPLLARSIVAEAMRRTYRRLRSHGASRTRARSTALHVRHAAAMVAMYEGLR